MFGITNVFCLDHKIFYDLFEVKFGLNARCITLTYTYMCNACLVFRGRNYKQPVRCQWHLKVEKLDVKYMTAFKVTVVKTKFLVAKND